VAVPGRHPARRGDAGRGQPGLPAPPGRRRGRAPELVVRRVRPCHRVAPVRSPRRRDAARLPRRRRRMARSRRAAALGCPRHGPHRADVPMGVSQPAVSGVLRRLAWATLVANILLIVTGGAVRLTGSGLGCPTWPRCTDSSFTPHGAMSLHAAIEFGNRLLTFVLVAIAVATYVAARQVARRLDRP